MPTNHYFQSGSGIGSPAEKRLYEDLIMEGLRIYGHDCYYLPRTLVNQDLILGEDVLSKFDDSYLLEMYIETTEGFADDDDTTITFDDGKTKKISIKDISVTNRGGQGVIISKRKKITAVE